MNRFFELLDKSLTTVLLILVVAMVFSITAEIVLNAAVQPVASGLLKTIETDMDETDEADISKKKYVYVRGILEGLMDLVANLSAPVNTSSQTLLIWIGILGSALAFRMRAHLGVDALVRMYPPKVRLVLDYISTFLIGVFSLTVLVIGGFLVSYRAFSLGSKMPGFEHLNRGWFYLVLIITGILNLIYCFYHFKYPKPVGGMELEKKEQKDL